NNSFGSDVGISGDTVVVSAPGKTVGTHFQQGAAYVYVKPVGGWKDLMQSSELEPSDGGAGDLFGFAVGIDGPTIAVGSVHHQVGLSKQGAAYVFANPTF